MGNLCKSNKIANLSQLNYEKKGLYSEKCLICWNKMANYIYIPCGHFGICESCKNKMNEAEYNRKHVGCPFCKNISSQPYKIYFCGKKYDSNDNLYELIENQKNEIQKLISNLDQERLCNNIIRQREEIMQELKNKLE